MEQRMDRLEERLEALRGEMGSLATLEVLEALRGEVKTLATKEELRAEALGSRRGCRGWRG